MTNSTDQGIKTVLVERETRIDSPAAAVYERIADFHRWRAWWPFEDLDPGMDRTYAGADAGVGAVYEWSGNLKAGAGRMEIVEAVEGERVVIEQSNRKPLRSRSTSTFLLDASGDGTTVRWAMVAPRTVKLERVSARDPRGCGDSREPRGRGALVDA